MTDDEITVQADVQRLARVVKLITDRVPLEGLRVLDLACRTGIFASWLAACGAHVLGIEGRQENLDQVPTVTFDGGQRAIYRLGDVRDLASGDGLHDVTLCLGILYHLDAPDVIQLLRAMRAVTTKFAIIDTHVALDWMESVAVGDQIYGGYRYTEPEGPWAGLGNETSWWFTEPALYAAVAYAGWDDVQPVAGRGWDGEAPDRRWLVIS